MSWEQQCNWDDEIPANTKQFWNNWLSNLHNLQKIKIPRRHFSSSRKYFSCMYKNIDNNMYNKSEVAFVISKTRLAPLKKKLSIPRLELQGAVLGLKVKKLITSNFGMEINKTCFWTDSRVVLHWINSS